LASIGPNNYNKIATTIYNIPSKVATTAKLAGVKGSDAERENIASGLKRQLSKMIKDSFDQKESLGFKPIILKEEVEEFFEKLAPNVSILVESAQDGGVKPLVSGKMNTIKSYILRLPFETMGSNYFIKKSDSAKLDTLNHEASHLFGFIAAPKNGARFNPANLPEPTAFAGWSFYKKTLYWDETSDSSVFGGINAFRKHLVEDKNARIDSVKNKINGFFKENFCIPSEKIELLQSWRHNLKSEVLAYKEEYTKGTSKEIYLEDSITDLANGKNISKNYIDETGTPKFMNTNKHKTLGGKIKEVKTALEEIGRSDYSSLVDQELFLPQKIKVIEELLRNEIAQVRANLKSLYGKK